MLLLRIGTASADGRKLFCAAASASEMPRRCGEIPHGTATARVCVLSGIAENARRASCGARRCTAESSELEESARPKKAGQLQAGLRRFDLMSRAYKPVYEVLTGFSKALPQTDTVNAAVIGRLMNHVRMGYYPTDPENITHILRGIAFPEGVTTESARPLLRLRQGASGSLPTATTATPTAWSWTNTARRKRKQGSTASASAASFTARSAARHSMCCF